MNNTLREAGAWVRQFRNKEAEQVKQKQEEIAKGEEKKGLEDVLADMCTSFTKILKKKGELIPNGYYPGNLEVVQYKLDLVFREVPTRILFVRDQHYPDQGQEVVVAIGMIPPDYTPQGFIDMYPVESALEYRIFPGEYPHILIRSHLEKDKCKVNQYYYKKTGLDDDDHEILKELIRFISE